MAARAGLPAARGRPAGLAAVETGLRRRRRVSPNALVPAPPPPPDAMSRRETRPVPVWPSRRRDPPAAFRTSGCPECGHRRAPHRRVPPNAHRRGHRRRSDATGCRGPTGTSRPDPVGDPLSKRRVRRRSPELPACRAGQPVRLPMPRRLACRDFRFALPDRRRLAAGKRAPAPACGNASARPGCFRVVRQPVRPAILCPLRVLRGPPPPDLESPPLRT
jgi:hypothetical protein